MMMKTKSLLTLITRFVRLISKIMSLGWRCKKQSRRRTKLPKLINRGSLKMVKMSVSLESKRKSSTTLRGTEWRSKTGLVVPTLSSWNFGLTPPANSGTMSNAKPSWLRLKECSKKGTLCTKTTFALSPFLDPSRSSRQGCLLSSTTMLRWTR